MEETKINQILEGLKSSKREELIFNLNKTFEWFDGKDNVDNSTKLRVVDAVLEVITKNAYPFKEILKNSNYGFCSYFKERIKLYYATTDENIFSTLEEELFKQNPETIVNCRYYWNKYKSIHHSIGDKVNALNNTLINSRSEKTVIDVSTKITNLLDQLLVDGDISQERYDEFCEKVYNNSLEITKRINNGEQTYKDVIKTYKRLIKSNVK